MTGIRTTPAGSQRTSVSLGSNAADCLSRCAATLLRFAKDKNRAANFSLQSDNLNRSNWAFRTK